MKELYRQMIKTGGAITTPLAGAAMLGLPAVIAGGTHGLISGYLANREDPDVGNRALGTAGYGALVAGVPAALAGAYGGHQARRLMEAAKDPAALKAWAEQFG